MAIATDSNKLGSAILARIIIQFSIRGFPGLPIESAMAEAKIAFTSSRIAAAQRAVAAQISTSARGIQPGKPPEINHIPSSKANSAAANHGVTVARMALLYSICRVGV